MPIEHLLCKYWKSTNAYLHQLCAGCCGIQMSSSGCGQTVLIIIMLSQGTHMLFTAPTLYGMWYHHHPTSQINREVKTLTQVYTASEW